MKRRKLGHRIIGIPARLSAVRRRRSPPAKSRSPAVARPGIQMRTCPTVGDGALITMSRTLSHAAVNTSARLPYGRKPQQRPRSEPSRGLRVSITLMATNLHPRRDGPIVPGPGIRQILRSRHTVQASVDSIGAAQRQCMFANDAHAFDQGLHQRLEGWPPTLVGWSKSRWHRGRDGLSRLAPNRSRAPGGPDDASRPRSMRRDRARRRC